MVVDTGQPARRGLRVETNREWQLERVEERAGVWRTRFEVWLPSAPTACSACSSAPGVQVQEARLSPGQDIQLACGCRHRPPSATSSTSPAIRPRCPLHCQTGAASTRIPIAAAAAVRAHSSSPPRPISGHPRTCSSPRRGHGDLNRDLTPAPFSCPHALAALARRPD